MSAVKKTQLQWIKGLMLFSQVLLLAFTAHWLMSQYNEQQEQLKKNITKVFTDVQQKITDSLLLTHVIDPAGINPLVLRSSDGDKIVLSPQGIHKTLLAGARLTTEQEKKLFRMDTIAFNEIFESEMKQNGWNFNAEWINSSDSDTKGDKAIFIQSSFFTNANGVLVDNFRGFLFWRLWPQYVFALILLSLTSAAFLVTYRSLKAQLKLSAMKDDFISNMSHELKTPIATVKVALEAMTSFNIIDDPKLSREYLGMAASEMDRLELLATRVLNTALLESGRIYMQQESYDLKKLTDEVILSMQPRLQKSNATIRFNVSGSAFLIPMDKLHMQGVLINLLDNSLKYGNKPVHIEITLTEQNGAVRLSLTDNGPGIPEEFKEKVFEKFFRVPTGNRHNTKGYGLGLSYAAQVMRQHNGSINVQNITEGGCMFTLSF